MNMGKKCFWPRKIKKPDWIPDPLIMKFTRFFLYPIIFASFAAVAYKTLLGEIGWFVLLVFAINLIANLIFFPLQIRLKNLFLANIDISIIFGTIIAQTVLISRYSDTLALMQIPNLVWVSIAAVLQFSVSYLNK